MGEKTLKELFGAVLALYSTQFACGVWENFQKGVARFEENKRLLIFGILLTVVLVAVGLLFGWLTFQTTILLFATAFVVSLVTAYLFLSGSDAGQREYDKSLSELSAAWVVGVIEFSDRLVFAFGNRKSEVRIVRLKKPVNFVSNLLAAVEEFGLRWVYPKLFKVGAYEGLSAANWFKLLIEQMRSVPGFSQLPIPEEDA